MNSPFRSYSDREHTPKQSPAKIYMKEKRQKEFKEKCDMMRKTTENMSNLSDLVDEEYENALDRQNKLMEQKIKNMKKKLRTPQPKKSLTILPKFTPNSEYLKKSQPKEEEKKTIVQSTPPTMKYYPIKKKSFYI